MPIVLLVTLLAAFSSPAAAYDEYRWLLRFNNAEGVGCLGARPPSCSSYCHGVAETISHDVAGSADIGSVVRLPVGGQFVVINAVHSTQDRQGRAWVTRNGCLYRWTGG